MAQVTFEQAVELHSDLVAWWRSPVGKRYLDAPGLFADYQGPSDGFHEYMFEAHAEAAPFWVTNTVLTEVQRRAETIDRRAASWAELPAPNGFVVFEEPFVMPSGPDSPELWVRAMSWWLIRTDPDERPSDQGVTLMFYDDRARLWEGDEEELALTEQRMGFTFNRLLPLTSVSWDIDQPWDVTDNPGERSVERVHSSVDRVRRFVLAFWRFTQEPIVEIRRRPPSRAVHRRVERAGVVNPDAGALRVVILRNKDLQYTEVGEPVSRDVAWSHRWRVRPHWRNQWYPSAHEHRRIWIEEYIKGPGDRSVVSRTAAFRVQR